MKKEKRNRLILFLLLIVVFTLIMLNKISNNNNTITVVSEIKDYNYKLESNETRIYKKYFKELEKIISSDKVDEEKYAEVVTKLFLIDFYTLNNKVTNQDVGGLQFLNSNIKDNFYLKAINTIYKYIKSDIYNNRNQQLPEVKDVKIISIEHIKFDEKDIKDNLGYQIDAEISYQKNLDYDKKVIVRLVHEEQKITVIEIEKSKKD